MIYTSSYNNYKSNLYLTYDITSDLGKRAKYQGISYRCLIPSRTLLKFYQDNKRRLSKEELERIFILKYYQENLINLNPLELYKKLNNFYTSILLSYEEATEFSHRHIIASWLELLLDVKIQEVKIIDSKIELLERPSYIKNTLESVMKENINMKGFNSLRALFLYQMGERIEARINLLKNNTKNDFDNYQIESNRLKDEARIIEENYNKEKILRK